MIPETKHASSCNIRFGISGLRSPGLMENFYPEDIPEDWLLDYYKNEFSLILLNTADLFSLYGPETESAAIIADVLAELYEDIAGENFLVLLDISDLSEAHLKTLMQERPQLAKTIVPVDVKQLCVNQSSTFSVPIQWQELPQQNQVTLLYYVTVQQTMEPVKLKQMIEQIHKHADAEEAGQALVIFAACQTALENCRNAILLESMM